MKSDSSRICSIKRRLPETCNGNKLRNKQVKYAWPSRAELKKKSYGEFKDLLIEKIQWPSWNASSKMFSGVFSNKKDCSGLR